MTPATRYEILDQPGGSVAKNRKRVFKLLIPCIYIQLIYQSTNLINGIKVITSIKLLHVSTPG
jgi:hypothetical protein